VGPSLSSSHCRWVGGVVVEQRRCGSGGEMVEKSK
jgi:hypothetical protein